MQSTKRHRAGLIGVILAVLLSLAGLVLSAILLQHHLVVEVGGNPVFQSVCEVTEHSSCDEVLASEWGKIEWGQGDKAIRIPTAMLGLFFFAAMASWFIVIGRPRGPRRWLHLIPVLAAVVGVGGCGFLDYVMFVRLDSWCPFCLATHIVAAVLLAVTLLLWPRRYKPIGAAGPPAIVSPVPAKTRATLAATVHPSLYLVVLAILLAGVTSFAAWGAYHYGLQKAYADGYKDKWEGLEAELQAAASMLDKKQADYQDAQEKWRVYDTVYRTAYEKFLAQEQFDIPISADDPVRGPADAPHTVVVCTDFQCPFCRGLALMLKQRREEYPGRFRIVFKHFPMNTKCNDHIKRTLYAASCAAAVTAEAAWLVGGNEAFWKMYDELFDDPKGFARGSQDFVKAATGRTGIDHDQLWGHIRTTSIWERVRGDVEQAHALGVDSTPVMFFDGRRLGKWGDKLTWRYLLQLDQTEQTATRPQTTQPSTQPATHPG